LCMIPLLMSYFVMGSWEFGFVACKLFWTVENVNKLLSVAILAIMSFERFIAVCKPFRWQCCKTSRSVCIILCSLVSSVVVLCAPIIYYARTSKHPVYSWNTTTPLYTKILCSSDLPDSILPFFIMYIFVLGFLIPVIVIVVCYIFIVRHIRAKMSRGLSVLNYSFIAAHVYFNCFIDSANYV
uniref:G-protein coupled receptors family 1 profile domain-containing protein n=1 Tax=Parascaris univalens TaxID=6257 RepID=A0A914ZY63_PARUN